MLSFKQGKPGLKIVAFFDVPPERKTFETVEKFSTDEISGNNVSGLLRCR